MLLQCSWLRVTISRNIARIFSLLPWLYILTFVSDASFAENFYGLKRRRRPFIATERTKAAVGGIPQGEGLRRPEIWRSLVFLVRHMHTF